MKRGEIAITGLSDNNFEGTDPLSTLISIGLIIPDFAINCVVSVRREKGTIRALFYENENDTLTQYSKFLLFRRKPDATIFYYNRSGHTANWIKIPAPTLVSLHVESRLH